MLVAVNGYRARALESVTLDMIIFMSVLCSMESLAI